MSAHPWLEFKNWAVVGASRKASRYGYMIVKKLEAAGYNPLPVTPKYEDIDGRKAYESVLDIEGDIDVVNFVVNPHIGMKVLDECIEKGVKRIWLQPGTVSKNLVKKAEENGIQVVEACILVVLNYI